MIRDTLLVIDDSELDLAILNEIFKHHFRVECVMDAHRGLSCLKHERERICAVLLDICLGRRGAGFTVLHQLQLDQTTAELPVILISMAAPFCDIGMLGLPDPEDHREEGDPRHTILGHELLAVEGDLPLLRYGAEIALWHHRNADGSGWPQDMDGEAPLSAMLVHTALRLQHYLHYYQGYEDALDRAVRTMKGEVGSILTEEMAGLLEETQQLRAALL